jgi:endonuclease III
MAKRAATRKVPKPAKTPAETRTIMRALGTQHPNADTELHYSNAYELLVATILSAQCTDERVNQVTPALFKRYPNAAALARATTSELEPQIVSTGFFRAKSRSLLGMATEIVEAHGGEIPRTMEELVKLPGVGRKTANVVLGHALGVPGLPVDRHVLRVANRIGIAKSDDPEVVEQQLGEAMPPAEWTRTSDTLILHGRRICKPRPLCDRCVVRTDCNFYATLVRAATGAQSAERRQSRESLPEVASTRAAKRPQSRKSLPEVAGTPAAKRRQSRKSLPEVASTRAAKRRGAH